MTRGGGCRIIPLLSRIKSRHDKLFLFLDAGSESGMTRGGCRIGVRHDKRGVDAAPPRKKGARKYGMTPFHCHSGIASEASNIRNLFCFMGYN